MSLASLLPRAGWLGGVRHWLAPAPPLPAGACGERWRAMGPVWERFPRVPTMLTGDELQLLAWLARDCYTGRGTIVDCGPFLGGSTSSLCAGLRDNPGAFPKLGRVHVYDRFVYDGYFRPWFATVGGTYSDGDSFLPAYRRLNAGHLDYLQIHAGDIVRARYRAGPVEILFLDVCKTWEINAWVVRTLFPRLIPGRSLVVQQDYLHFFAHWLVITMDYFRDYLVPVDRVEYGHSALFRLVKPIPPRMLDVDLRSLPLEQKSRAFAREVERSGGWQRDEILVSWYRFLLGAGDEAGARAVARRLPERADNPITAASLATVADFLPVSLSGGDVNVAARGWRPDPTELPG